jgi:hypothetical protein
MIWERVAHITATFGLEPLRHLALPPPRGSGRQRIAMFAVPFPEAMADHVGGQYQMGTAFFFYGPDRPAELGQVVAHEYLHAYNTSALFLDSTAVADLAWFSEGYTDVHATLANLGLTPGEDGVKLRLLRTALVLAWARMRDQDPGHLIAELVTDVVPAGARSEIGRSVSVAAPPGSVEPRRPVTGRDGLWSDARSYSRAIDGRGKLLVFGLALLLERARPRRVGFDAWLSILLRAHPATSASGSGIDDKAIRAACLQAALGSAGEVSNFFERYVDGSEDVSLDELKRWLDDPALLDLCRPINIGTPTTASVRASAAGSAELPGSGERTSGRTPARAR